MRCSDLECRECRANGDSDGVGSDAGVIFNSPIKAKHRSAEVNRSEFSVTEIFTVLRRSRLLALTDTLGEVEAQIRLKTYDLLYKRATSQLSRSAESEGSNKANARMGRFVDEYHRGSARKAIRKRLKPNRIKG
jgi:hypothetical protein